MAVADASVARPGGLNVLAARWQEFSRWWLAELRAILPSGWLTWLEGEALPRLLMWRDRDLVVCRLALPAGTIEVRLPVVSFKAMLNAWLAEHGLGREQVMIGHADLVFAGRRVRALTLVSIESSCVLATCHQQISLCFCRQSSERCFGAG